ncbi:hypothetical protein Micbo1qcDRAFT_201810 [Microdochium bolleyi]|uniref:Cyanovirin-N domain-containing protein n=1 Tax=Microdochium bolleyi TaxID=196109 RepID=A0A136J9V8_9PEZI|nr:hypothetical protein Micbo1qcDRAFT_201810 [Microdochium bolleyi]
MDHTCNQNLYSQIHVNKCLANMGGHLTPRHNGNALDSCYGCYISKDWYELHCVCPDDQGNRHVSAINLNEVLHNWFGYISCFGEHETGDGYEHSYPCKEPDDWQPDSDSYDDTCRDGCPEVIPSWPFDPPNSGGSKSRAALAE